MRRPMRSPGLAVATTTAALAFGATLSLFVVWPQARQSQQSPQATQPAQQPQGWAVRASLGNRPLYNTAKQKLLDGKQIFSTVISRRDPELYCQVAPHYDFVWFEMQHSTMSFADVEAMIAACPRVGIPMIRVADELESTMQKATDIGALGIVMPTVDTVEKALATVRYSKFPPEGRRSQGGGQATTIWGANGVNYRQTANDNILIVAMIETPVGVANAVEIARLPGIDVVMGANTDLSNFSGLPPTDPEYHAMFTKIHDATLRAGKFLGATTAAFAAPGPQGRPDGADFRMFYTGSAFDGYRPPARGAAPAPAANPGRGGR
jgi:2-keto-3-deoxy-L-rhamnonate aldolase RhmA